MEGNEFRTSDVPANTIVGPKGVRLSLQGIFNQDSNPQDFCAARECELLILPKDAIETIVTPIPEVLEI